ncbi:MAG: hypothetical protein ACXVAP_03475 [Candidatus Limnocylindrales bacterium]
MAPRWRWPSLVPWLAALTVALAGSTGSARAATYPASVYTNVTAFDTCDGTPDTISHSLKVLAQNGFVALGYASAAYETSGFTKAQFLARTPADQAVYVHSHGDQYYAPNPKQVQGFRDDGGDCTQAITYATEVKARRTSGAHLVLMSTCHLAEVARTAGQPTMSEAYGIERLKSTVNGSYRGPEFYLSYVGLAYTADMLRFEQKFWAYIGQGRGLGDAFTLARANAGMSAATVPDWFGEYVYTGRPDGSPGCLNCQ